jgi:GNAT superfamily N-acetyltransferase
LYKILKNIPGHIGVQDKVTLKLWPEFMLNDPVSNNNWVKLFEYFSDYQFSVESGGEVIGVANSLPFFWDRPYGDLPDGGWDWVFLKGIEDYHRGISPNVLNGLQIAVKKDFQGSGISSFILKEMISLAREKGFRSVTIPVRPSLKSRYPLAPIDNYIRWQGVDGLPFDPWLRVHVRMGGTIIKACKKAMEIPGTVAEWEKWTNMRFPETGDYVVKGALSPVKVDVERDKGVYIEPNVWVVHPVD